MNKEMILTLKQKYDITNTLRFLSKEVYNCNMFSKIPTSDLMNDVLSFKDIIEKKIQCFLEVRAFNNERRDWQSIKSELPSLCEKKYFTLHEEKFIFSILWGMDWFLDSQITFFCKGTLFSHNNRAQNLIKQYTMVFKEPTVEEVKSVCTAADIEEHPSYADGRSKRKIIKIIKEEMLSVIKKMKSLSDDML